MRRAAMAMWRCSRSGPRYEGIAPKDQRLTAAALRVGRNAPRHWAAPPRPVDLFDAKADALALLTALGAPVENLQTTTDAPAWFHPGRSGVLRLGATVLASFGELHPRVLAALDVKGPVGRLRDRYRPHPPAPRQDGAGPAAAEGLAFPAHRARLRLCRRGGYAGGEAGPRRQERGQGADHQRLRLRPVRGGGAGRGPQIDRAVRRAAADGAHPDRGGDRGGGREDRRRRQQGDGRDAPGLGLPNLFLQGIYRHSRLYISSLYAKLRNGQMPSPPASSASTRAASARRSGSPRSSKARACSPRRWR